MENKKHFIQLLCILFLGSIFMLAATPVDQPFSAWLRAHYVQWFDIIMSDSVFEGEILGSGDYTIFTMIFCLICYIFAWHYERKRRKPGYHLPAKTMRLPKQLFFSPERLIHLRPYLGYILFNGFCVAVLFVHTIKWIMARPRPMRVLRGDHPYSDWYQVGAHFITEGVYRGSFPSGHVTTTMALLGVAYCLLYTAKGKVSRLAAKAIFGVVITLGLLMCVSRVMNEAHWTTDVIFSFFGGWIVTHIMFFWGYRLPERITERDSGVRSFDVPYVELLYCLLLFLTCLGGMCFFIGIRGFSIYSFSWILLIVVGGLLCSVFSCMLLYKLGLFKPPSAQ